MDYSHLEFVKEEDPLALDEEKTELDIEINDFDHEKESFLSQDDPHVASLECHVTGCEFITEPVDLKLLKVAANMLKLHMLGAHRKVSESNYEESNNKKTIDPNDFKTCPHCFKMFFDKYTMKRHTAQRG